MTGSMYSAVSGLKAHMSALSVIGNNVSNVNTLGYKATRYTFNEAIYSTTRDGSDGSVILGGRNPAQVGYGANMGGISALLTMINSCANGISVVNIDDGYGAGYIATQINRLAVR